MRKKEKEREQKRKERKILKGTPVVVDCLGRYIESLNNFLMIIKANDFVETHEINH